LKILVTSREILSLEGEATYYLAPLSTPDDNTSLEKLRDYESIQLFVERAVMAVSSFRLTRENAKPLIKLCRRVDGVPLTLELAAAHANILQVEEILKQLDNSFALLAGDNRTILPRHQTLRASMDWSWGLLSEMEQKFLEQLSVFAGGWTLESAQIVCDGDPLNLISALVKKSLIVVNRDARYETRYHFHEIVRQYAYEKLGESGEEANIRSRHLKYFLQFSEQAEIALEGPNQVEWYSRLEKERDNIRGALDWANERDVEAGLYISGRIHHFWEIYDQKEGSYWLSKFLQKRESYAFPKARAKALLVYGMILFELQQFDTGFSLAKECLELYRTLGDQQGVVDGLIELARETPKTTEKMVLIHQALSLAQSIGDVARQAGALMQLGWIDQSNRFSHWEKAIELARPLQNWRWLVGNLGEMGYFLVLNRDIASAQKYLDESAKLCKQLNINPLPGSLLSAYGQMELLRGNFEKARSYFREESKIGIEFGGRQSYLWSHVRLGYVALREGNLNEARETFAETAQEFQKDNYTIGVVFALEGMAGLYVALDESKCAARLIGWTDSARKKIGDARPLVEQADVDKIIAASLAKMGEAAFVDAYEEGQQMTLDEAVAYALNES
jgi:predicted ATPase